MHLLRVIVEALGREWCCPMAFDPYYEWLGIPPEEQPPDHYRLLGVRRFEPNATVIENSAERQMLLLKTRQNGPHSSLTQQLMNEVSSARICLLDLRRRFDYDAMLRGRDDDAKSSSLPVKEVFPPALEELEVLARSQSEDPLRTAPASRQRLAKTARTCHTARSDGAGQPASLGLLDVHWLVVCGGSAAIGVCLLGVVWLLWGSADSRDVAELAGAGQLSAVAAPRTTPAPQPPRPPAPVTRQDDPSESASEPAGKQLAAADQTMPRVRPPAARPSGSGRVACDEPGSSSSPAPKVHERPRGPATRAPSDVSGSGDLGISASAGSGLAPATGRLAMEFDLVAAIAATGPADILLGELPARSDANWEIGLEDYSSPVNAAVFQLGEMSSAENLRTWPVRCLAAASDAAPAAPASVDDPAGQSEFGHLEIGSRGLRLSFASTASPELIERFCSCGLTVQDGGTTYRIQFHKSERMPPVEIRLDKPKETVALGEMLTGIMLSTDRIVLEILRVEMGATQAPNAAGLRANLDKELAVTLDSQLQCELGIKLAENAGQFDLLVLPRYVVNDRRQQLLPAEIKKDLSKAQRSSLGINGSWVRRKTGSARCPMS